MPLGITRNDGQSLVFNGGVFSSPMTLTFHDTGDGVRIDSDGREIAYASDADAPNLELTLAPNVRVSILCVNLSRGTSWLDLGIQAPHEVHVRRGEIAPR